MPTVFDNIETPFLDGEDSNGLKHALKLGFRGDFCVGYFNLRGWRCIDSVVNEWPLPTTDESPPPARLLVGMQRTLGEQMKSGRLCVKLFLKHTLHAKLYLAHRADTINPIIAHLCTELNATETMYPGTDLRLIFKSVSS